MRALLLALLVAAPARAYTIGTAFTAPCHERVTAAAFERATLRRPAQLGERSRLTRALMRQYAEAFTAAPGDDVSQWLLLSLVVGVRVPDGEGFSPTDFTSTRALQLAPEVQYLHALRRADDDGEEGNVAALAGTRQALEALIAASREQLALPEEQQVLLVTTFVADYGSVQVEVWGPAYFAGRAAHLVQDSYSHALRSDDLRRVRHVFNFVDALSSSFDEARDGHRHSNSLDACTERTQELTDAARGATEQLFLETLGQEVASGSVVERLELEPGCAQGNGYCASRWSALAAERQSYAVLGCSTGGPSLVGLSLCLALRRRRRERHDARA